MIRIAATQITPRLEYAIEFALGTVLGLAWRLEPVSPDAPPDPGAIYYGSSPPSGKWGLYIPASGILSRTDTAPVAAVWGDWNGIPVLFPAPSGDLPFDLFGAVFYCLSRYEEYGSPHRDAHGRFPAVHSTLEAFLERPLVDEWIVHGLERALVAHGLIPCAATRKLQWINTIDIDIAYAYRGRGPIRTLGAAAKDVLAGRLHRFAERLRVLTGHQPDPFDTYALVREHAAAAAESHFFVLCGERGGYDINLDPRHTDMQSLLRSLKHWAQVGIHPSYASHGRVDGIAREAHLLANTLGEPVRHSRQHFLKFDLPATYRRIEAAGIARDFSMGYAERVGFRSGTAYVHRFFDLLENKALSVELVPLVAMDSAMQAYMQLSPEAALAKLQALWTAALPTGGLFTTVWHNHSLSNLDEWEGWGRVYRAAAAMFI